jgi:hypothetical protein
MIGDEDGTRMKIFYSRIAVCFSFARRRCRQRRNVCATQIAEFEINGFSPIKSRLDFNWSL